MNFNTLHSKYFNKNLVLNSKKQAINSSKSGTNDSFNLSTRNNCDNNINLSSYPKTYYLNQISFGGRFSADELIKKIGEDNFPNQEIVRRLRALGSSKDFSLYNIHLDYYKDLLDCQTLDEAKELYPEFRDVVDAKDIDITSVDKKSALYKIYQGDFKDVNIEDLSLEILKNYYGKLISTGKQEEYWGISRNTINSILNKLNIKKLDNGNYLHIITSQSSEYKAAKSQMLKNQWQNPDSVYNSDEHRIKKSQVAVKLWQDPKFAQKHSDALTALWQDAVFKEKHSQASTELWLDHKFREKMLQIFNCEEYREKQSQIHKVLWQDPDSIFNTSKYRAKLVQSSQERWQDPQFREKMSQIMNSDEHKEKMKKVYEAARIAYDMHPEVRDMMSETAMSFPMLGRILEQKEKGIKLNEKEEITLQAYYKKCEKRMPGFRKIIGREQHKLLVEWGVIKD